MEPMDIDEPKPTSPINLGNRYVQTQKTVLEQLLPYLSIEDWPKLRLVCQGWNLAIIEQFKLMKDLKIQDFVGVNREKWSLDEPDWTSLHATRLHSFIDGIIKRRCKSVKTLRFFDYEYGPLIRVKPADLNNLAQPKFIEHLLILDLTGIKAPWQALFNGLLKNCVNLEKLYMRDTLRQLIPADNFEEEKLFDGTKAMTKLKYLDISGAKWMTGKIFQALPLTMETLIMDRCGLDHAIAARYIGRLVNLRCVSLDHGLTAGLAAAISNLPRLDTLMLDGESKGSPKAPSYFVQGLNKRLGVGLTTLCFGKNIKGLRVANMNIYFDHARTTLEKLELYSSNFNALDHYQLQPCLEKLGGLTELTHLELAMDDRLQHSSAQILAAVFRNCIKLETLAINCEFAWPCDGFGQHMTTLKSIGTLKEFKNLTWISINDLPTFVGAGGQMAANAPDDSTLIFNVLCDELGSRLRRLRYGIITQWLIPASDRLNTLTDVAELELIVPSKRFPTLDETQLANLASELREKLEKLSLLNTNKRSRHYNKMMVKLTETFPNMEQKAEKKCVRKFKPLVLGGGGMGIRENVNAISAVQSQVKEKE